MSALNVVERQSEDNDISEPDEDMLVGQMAAMRGGKVKRRDDKEEEGESEESSGMMIRTVIAVIMIVIN